MNKKIDITLSDEDLEELKEGKEFDWTFGEIDVHISNKEEGE